MSKMYERAKKLRPHVNLLASIYRRLFQNHVLHCTVDPYGPGAVRIHMVPPKHLIFGNHPSVVILNGGQFRVPIKKPYAILLGIFMTEVSRYSWESLHEIDIKRIVKRTMEQMHLLYPGNRVKEFENALWKILGTLCNIAQCKTIDFDLGNMTEQEYSSEYHAPSRMDLMVSAMTRETEKGIVWKCNLRCKHCYAAGQYMSGMRELSTQEWKKIIDKCRKIGISALNFTGGEPCMREDLVELIDYSRWFVTRLNTNGILLTAKLCKALFKASLDVVQVTLYSDNSEEHDFLVGRKGAFELTVQGIKNAVNAGLAVSINTPICTYNSNYVSTLDFIKKLGVRYVSCSSLIVTGNATSAESKSSQLSEKELKKILFNAKAYCDKEEMEIAFTSPGWLSEDFLKTLSLYKPICGACRSNMAISPDGKVVPCQSWLSEDAVLGDMLRDKWKNIWESDKCEEIRTKSVEPNMGCLLRKKEGC